MTRDLVPLLVRAHLAAGVAHAGPWGIALDGLLAAELWDRHKAACRDHSRDYVRARDVAEPADLDLPLARCEVDADSWHWAATCAWPEHRIEPVVHTWTGRVDPRALEQVSLGLPKTVSERQGRYRARRMPLLVDPAPTVTWHGVGDVDEIRALLGGVDSIGKKRSSGEGHVLRWDVAPAPQLDPFTAGHLHPDASVGRTCPAACRGQIPPESLDGGWSLAGIRPPYMHPGRQRQLVVPAR